MSLKLLMIKWWLCLREEGRKVENQHKDILCTIRNLNCNRVALGYFLGGLGPAFLITLFFYIQLYLYCISYCSFEHISSISNDCMLPPAMHHI